MVGGEINYRECDKFSSVKLEGDLAKYGYRLVNACEAVAKIMLKDRTESYASFVKQITYELKEAKVRTGRGEIVRPIAGIGASAIIAAVDHIKGKVDVQQAAIIKAIIEDKKINGVSARKAAKYMMGVAPEEIRFLSPDIHPNTIASLLNKNDNALDNNKLLIGGEFNDLY